jgi:hypothetical protein
MVMDLKLQWFLLMWRRVRLSGRKNQKRYYSGKKKRHTYKTQLIVNRQSGEIICTAHAEGSKHDFTLYQDSRDSLVSEGILFQGDNSYQGILKLHKNSDF